MSIWLLKAIKELGNSKTVRVRVALIIFAMISCHVPVLVASANSTFFPTFSSTKQNQT